MVLDKLISTKTKKINLQKLLSFILFINCFIYSQFDARLHHHGACVVEYNDNNIGYYLTWSSNYRYGWEHNIFNSIIQFDNNGDIEIVKPSGLYIGDSWDEAQEPVNATINAVNNYILSVWEDGSDDDHPNVRGQLHHPDGSIIKKNWIIAGGDGSQHSAQTAHLVNRYLVFYADEAPPATVGAVVKGKVIDDLTGEEKQTIQFSPNDEDHWWPITISNKRNTRTLIIWGNDGYSVMGTVLYQNSDTIALTQKPQDYIVNTQQYYYHAEWLEEISCFLIIARHGAYENLSDKSRICLVDTLGNNVRSEIIDGGILREAKMAAKWDKETKKYHLFFPSDTNDLIHLVINDSGFISDSVEHISDHEDLNNIKWVSTGIWSTFVKASDGNDELNGDYVALFIQNDTFSDDIQKIPVRFPISMFHDVNIAENKKDNRIGSFTNVKNTFLRIKLDKEFENVLATLSVYNTKGQSVLAKDIYTKMGSLNFDISNFTLGQYFYKLKIK